VDVVYKKTRGATDEQVKDWFLTVLTALVVSGDGEIRFPAEEISRLSVDEHGRPLLLSLRFDEAEVVVRALKRHKERIAVS